MPLSRRALLGTLAATPLLGSGNDASTNDRAPIVQHLLDWEITNLDESGGGFDQEARIMPYAKMRTPKESLTLHYGVKPTPTDAARSRDATAMDLTAAGHCVLSFSASTCGRAWGVLAITRGGRNE